MTSETNGVDTDLRVGIDVLLGYVAESTQKLLRDTIVLTDEQWQQPCGIRYWTRAHLGAHLSRSADALVEVLTHLESPNDFIWERFCLPVSERAYQIERGSERSAVDLQIDLDTSSGRLLQALNVLTRIDPNTKVRTSQDKTLPAWMIAALRLRELTVHHFHMDCGFTVDDVNPEISPILLDWFFINLGLERPSDEFLASFNHTVIPDVNVIMCL